MQGKLKKEERNLLKEEEEHETKKIKDEIKIQRIKKNKRRKNEQRK